MKKNNPIIYCNQIKSSNSDELTDKLPFLNIITTDLLNYNNKNKSIYKCEFLDFDEIFQKDIFPIYLFCNILNKYDFYFD